MCGIFGVIDGRGDAAGDVRHRLELLYARGPDGGGEYVERPLALAMRRLAVIDPQGGRQPLYGRGGRVVAFQNGEIYNYRNLRRELEAAGAVFVTDSDTEVLAHGYDRWGIDGLLARLDGMFALAIFDRDSRVLHLARDRFGEKPLFWTCVDGRFAYGSNLLALAGLPWAPLAVDPRAIDSYLALQFTPGPQTPFRHIRRLLPGQRLETPVDAPDPRIVRYWRPPLTAPVAVGEEEMAALVENAVRSRLVADVPVGVFLSGGIDSSTVAALAARAQPGIATFSIGFEDPRYDESPWAEAVARHIGSTHHAIRFGAADFDAHFDDVVAAMDEPLGDQAALPTYLLSRAARRDVTVALSGEGADEIFAGYEHYGFVAPADAAGLTGIDRHGLGAVLRAVQPGAGVTPAGVPHLLSAENRRALTGWSDPGEPEAWEVELAEWLGTSACPLQRVCAADVALSLPDRLLVKVDRVSMANSLEVRAPFLDPALAAAALNLPAGERMSGGVAKRALRRVARDLLPENVLNRPKQVFAVPLLDWLRRRVADAGGSAVYARRHAMPLMDPDLTARLLDQALRPGMHSNIAFSVCMLLEWHSRLVATLREYRYAKG
jgi:asparagine synthase (glutamine-hydrolysing)